MFNILKIWHIDNGIQLIFESLLVNMTVQLVISVIKNILCRASPMNYLVFIAFLLTRVVERILGTDSLWEKNWLKVIDFIGEDNDIGLVIGLSFTLYTIYWFLGCIFMFWDVFKKPEFLTQYRIQQKANDPVDTDQLKKTVKTVLMNQLFIGIPMLWLTMQIAKRQSALNVRDVPSFQRLCLDIMCYSWIHEIMFYCSHRIMHHKWFYKNIHKQHHEWKAPQAIAALYCHPLEQVMCNFLPSAAGFLVMRSTIASGSIWLAFTAVKTLHEHSGYHLPFVVNAEFHDYHHLKFNQNFGITGFMDYIFGTDKEYRKSVNFSRDKVLFSFNSAHEEVPEFTDQNNNIKMD